MVHMQNKYGLLLLFILCCSLSCCQKKCEFKLPESDAFDVLSGEGMSSWQYVQTKEDVEHLKFFTKLYELKKGLLSIAADSYRIPKIVHFIWMGPQPFPRVSVENVRTWMARHPDLDILFLDGQRTAGSVSRNAKTLYSRIEFLAFERVFSQI